MWVSKDFVEELRTRDRANHEATVEAKVENSRIQGENTRLIVENQRLHSTLEWFKHRLNQVEMERAQLIYAATGGTQPTPREVKVNVPQFLPEAGPGEAVNEQFRIFGSVGEDSDDPKDQLPEHMRNAPEAVENMPRHRG